MVLSQVHGLFRKEKGYWSIRFSVPEVKILLLLGYFIILGITALIAISVSVRNADPLIHDLFRYFTCNLLGYSLKCEDIRKEFEAHLNPALSSVTFLQLGFLAFVHILFAIRVQDVKKVMQCISRRKMVSV